MSQAAAAAADSGPAKKRCTQWAKSEVLLTSVNEMREEVKLKEHAGRDIIMCIYVACENVG